MLGIIERFKNIYKQSSMTPCKIIVDIETGVNYLFTSECITGGLTVLLDKDGKPVVTPVK